MGGNTKRNSEAVQGLKYFKLSLSKKPQTCNAKLRHNWWLGRKLLCNDKKRTGNESVPDKMAMPIKIKFLLHEINNMTSLYTV